jgi:hypothetical protein
MEEGQVKTEGTGQNDSTTAMALVPRPDSTSLPSEAPPVEEKGTKTLPGVRTEAVFNRISPKDTSIHMQKSLSEDMKAKMTKPKDHVLPMATIAKETRDITASSKSASKPQSEKSEKKKKEKVKKQGQKKVRKEGSNSGKKGEGGPQDVTGTGDDGDIASSSSKKHGPKKGKKKR